VTTQFGPFELADPLPALSEPFLLLSLRPWIDVGSVGTMTLTFLGDAWGSTAVAQIARPGRFYDFTRYRPTLERSADGGRRVSLPNTGLYHARSPDGRDWLFLHALEPHSHGDDFVEGVLGLIQHLGVRRYMMIGSMYAPVPHTRPPIVSGGSTNPELAECLRLAGVRESTYEGPTTILAILPALANEAGIETATAILQLPAYAQLEHDYRGLEAMLGLLSRVHGFTVDTGAVHEEAERQTAAIDESVRADPRARTWVAELETLYDAERSLEDQPRLSPELESFLKDLERRLE
jgi:hypothetical protein